MIETVSSSETSINICHTTLLYMPQDKYIYAGRRENRKSCKVVIFLFIYI
jgi:hypothetical protein